MSDPKPMNVYPDPNGGANSNAYVPSNTQLAGGAIVSGGVAAGAAATALGPALLTNSLALLQGATNGPAMDANRVLGVHGLTAPYVAVILFFGSLSVVLQVINLVLGVRMKERLRALSSKVSQMCRTAGLIP
jgi:hypothetical protein